MPCPHPTSPAAAWEEWRGALADAERSPATVKGYRNGLRWVPPAMFVGAWADLERPPLLAALRAADVAPDGTRRSPSTRTRNRKAWATLQGYADDLGFGPAVLKARDLKGAGFGQRTAIFAPAEWAALLAATACPRATLAFEGLRWSGMRPGELCTAEMRHLTESGGVPAIVLTEHKTAAKTGEDRVIPVVAALAPVLARAVDGRDAGPIWRDPAGGPWNPDRLNWAFRKARRAAALPAALKLYSTRHTRGTELVAEVGEIAAAAILGHKGVAMTKRYAHLAGSALGKIVAKIDARDGAE